MMESFVLLLLALIMLVIHKSDAASCGSSGIPFRLEVLPNGRVVLGCASPACFGAENGGRSIMHDSQFIQAADGLDGFFRDGDLQRLKNRHRDAPPELADCSATFSANSCSDVNSWVGGIVKNDDGSLRLQCCSYQGSRFATEMGKPLIHSGEVYSGGEVVRDGRQTGFDYISNIKSVPVEGKCCAYELTVKRMPCIPDPPEPNNYVDLDAQGEIGHILDKVGENNRISGTETDQVVQVVEPFEETIEQIEEPVGAQTPANTYYPVAYRPRCFSGDALVATSRGILAMRNIRIGDLVTTMDDNQARFTRVTAFLHRLPQEATEFIEFRISGGNILKVTPLHLVYRTGCTESTKTLQMIRARDLYQYDCVWAFQNSTNRFERSEVIGKRMVREIGAFAPLTDSGSIVVNDIFVSCHDFFRPSGLTEVFFFYMHKLEHWVRRTISDKNVELPFGTHFLIGILDQILPVS